MHSRQALFHKDLFRELWDEDKNKQGSKKARWKQAAALWVYYK